MALTAASLYSPPLTSPASILATAASSPSLIGGIPPPIPTLSYPKLLPSITFRQSIAARSRRRSHVVRMAPDEQRLTRRSPLDFPVEWERTRGARRPEILPKFSPMKTPLPPPLPMDPPFPDEIKEEEEEQEEQKDPNEEGEEGEGEEGEGEENPEGQ